MLKHMGICILGAVMLALFLFAFVFTKAGAERAVDESGGGRPTAAIGSLLLHA